MHTTVARSTPTENDAYRWPFEVQGERFQFRRIDRVAERRRELRAAAERAMLLLDAGEDTLEAVALLESGAIDAAIAHVRLGGTEGETRGRIEGWSAKSRRNMLRTLAGLDHVGHWGMLTLTPPGSWLDRFPTPESFKEARKALRRRWERRYGSWSAMWKLEFQRRGAPHFHVGIELPEGADDLAEWCRVNWHEIVCHPGGARCPGRVFCEHRDHLAHGAQLDTTYSRRLRTGRSAVAGYFAKHGVWSSKEYQHRRPGWKMRGYAGILDVMAGPGAGDSLRACADAWDCPGRWWGYEGMSAAPCTEGEMTAREVQAAKLIARKVVARRSWRYVEVEDHGTVFVRRSLMSLHDDAGFWLLMANPLEFVPWFLEHVREVARLDGVERARYLAGIEEPGARPAPRRNGQREAEAAGGAPAPPPPPHALPAAMGRAGP